jgi:class 3 adenylate cyclase
MDLCFERITAEVHRFEGTINQYTGDGVMPLFGAPIAHEDNPRRAVHAALGIQRALLRGVVLLRHTITQQEEAETWFCQAADVAHCQEVKALELCAARGSRSGGSRTPRSGW